MSIKPSSETLNFFDMDLLQCEPPVHALDLQHRHPIYLMHVMWLTKRFAFVHLKFCGCFSIRTYIFCLFYTITFEKHPHQIVYYTLYFIQIILFIIIFLSISLSSQCSLSLSHNSMSLLRSSLNSLPLSHPKPRHSHMAANMAIFSLGFLCEFFVGFDFNLFFISVWDDFFDRF